VVGVALVAPQFGGDVLDRLFEVGGSLEARGELYRQVLGMIASDPWLGFGAGTFEWAFPLFHLPELATGVVWDRAHSTYLTLWAELGLLFGSLPLAIVVLFGISAARHFVRAGTTGWSRHLASLGVLAV